MNRFLTFAIIVKAVVIIALNVAFHIKAAAAADLNKFATTTSEQLVTATANPFAGFSIGATAGGQMTDITLNGDGDYISGINADGFVGGLHAGYNFCPTRVCFGIEGEFAFSDVSVHVGDAGDVLEMDSYANIKALVGTLVGKSTFVDFHAGYEWEFWQVALGGDRDADVGVWVLGAGMATMIAPSVSLGVNLDYLILNDVEVDGAPSGFNDALTDALEDSDAFRGTVRLTWRPASPSSLSSLLNR